MGCKKAICEDDLPFTGSGKRIIMVRVSSPGNLKNYKKIKGKMSCTFFGSQEYSLGLVFGGVLCIELSYQKKKCGPADLI